MNPACLIAQILHSVLQGAISKTNMQSPFHHIFKRTLQFRLDWYCRHSEHHKLPGWQPHKDSCQSHGLASCDSDTGDVWLPPKNSDARNDDFALTEVNHSIPL